MEEPTNTTPSKPPGAVHRCEWTGQWIAPGDVTTLYNRKTSVQNKQKLLERLPRSPWTVATSWITAPIGSRLAAWLIDYAVVLTIELLVVLVFMSFLALSLLTPDQITQMQAGKFTSDQMQDALAPAKGTIDHFMPSLVIIPIVYFLVSNWLLGRTPGKWAMSLKVVRVDGGGITFQIALVRTAVFLFPNFVIVSMALTENDNTKAVLLLVATAVLMGNGMTLLRDTFEGRALHDRFASTRVVVAPRF